MARTGHLGMKMPPLLGLLAGTCLMWTGSCLPRLTSNSGWSWKRLISWVRMEISTTTMERLPLLRAAPTPNHTQQGGTAATEARRILGSAWETTHVGASTVVTNMVLTRTNFRLEGGWMSTFRRWLRQVAIAYLACRGFDFWFFTDPKMLTSASTLTICNNKYLVYFVTAPALKKWKMKLLSAILKGSVWFLKLQEFCRTVFKQIKPSIYGFM